MEDYDTTTEKDDFKFIVDICIEQFLDACINNSNLLKKESLL